MDREKQMARRKDAVAWSDPSLLILGSLASGPKHGYAIVQEIQNSAGVTMGPGTLYGALPRLEQRGLVRPLPGEDRRRPYELTAEGARVLRARLEAMHSFAVRGLALLPAATA
jgi:DNA-binding PadR family transcriptional regulator